MAEAASLVKCSEYSIRRWRRQMAATGSVWPDAELENGHEDAALRNEELVRVVLSLMEDEPVAFLRENSELLVAIALEYPALDTTFVSASTVQRILTAHGFTRKRVKRLFQERSLAAQEQFVIDVSEVPLRFIVSVDEVHTDGGDVLRKYGRSHHSTPCALLDRDPLTVARTSTMMGVSMTGGADQRSIPRGPAQRDGRRKRRSTMLSSFPSSSSRSQPHSAAMSVSATLAPVPVGVRAADGCHTFQPLRRSQPTRGIPPRRRATP